MIRKGSNLRERAIIQFIKNQIVRRCREVPGRQVSYTTITYSHHYCISHTHTFRSHELRLKMCSILFVPPVGKDLTIAQLFTYTPNIVPTRGKMHERYVSKHSPIVLDQISDGYY